MKKFKDKVIVILLAGFMFGMSILGIITPDSEYSLSERRKLAKFPELTWERVVNGKFMREFDDNFSLDSFIFRDTFRTAKAYFARGILMQKDSNDIYVADGYAAKLETLNDKSIQSAAEKFNKVYNAYLKGHNVYFSVIPDKGYFLAEKHGYPGIDYEKLVSIMTSAMDPDMKYIDMFDQLEISDYYTTDLHWDQSKIVKIAEFLGTEMGFADRLDKEYTSKELSPFYGVYYGQAALTIAPDKLTYLTNENFDSLKVSLFDTKKLEYYEAEMYNEDDFSGVDPYDVFLSGAEPLIVIENENAKTDKELFIFRDSFTSALAPLLSDAYSKITLIDMRYIDGSLLGDYVEFTENSDVLFLYSTLILNSSGTINVSIK